MGVNHTHTDHARTPINGSGARGLNPNPLDKKIQTLEDKQVFTAHFKGVYGDKVTVSTEYGPVHGVLIPCHEHINIRFLMGKLILS